MEKSADLWKKAVFVWFVMLVWYYIISSVSSSIGSDPLTGEEGNLEKHDSIEIDKNIDQTFMGSVVGIFSSKEEKKEQTTNWWPNISFEKDTWEINYSVNEESEEQGGDSIALENNEVDEIIAIDEVKSEVIEKWEAIGTMWDKDPISDTSFDKMRGLLKEKQILSWSIWEKNNKIDDNVVSLADLEKAWWTWWESLNVSGEVPGKGFRAIFFNTKDQKIWKTSIQDTISVAWAYNVNGIPSEDFWAYFVWNINITEKGKYEFYWTSGQSKTRLILDGRIINNWAIIDLDIGTYMFEAEHINNWHTVDFTAGYLKPIQEVDVLTARGLLSEVRKIQGLKIWYAGVYESDSHSIDMSLENSDAPVALVLSSYGSIQWNINANNTEVAAVIVSNLEKGSSVSGIWDVPILRMSYRDIPSLYSVTPSCSNTGWHFYCEWGLNEFEDLQEVTTNLLGNVPAWFSGKYSTTSFTLPWRVLDKNEYVKIQAEKDKILEMKKNTEMKKWFDNMFN